MMMTLDRLQHQLQPQVPQQTAGMSAMRKLPAVERWNPPLSGEIDICIEANGDWFHEGAKFTRPALASLFSSLLKKEGDEYFLVTPVEKWRIQVKDVPLFIIDFEVNGRGSERQTIMFRTSTGDEFLLDEQHSLEVRKTAPDHSKPYVTVRNNLQALVSRNVFYALAEMSVTVNDKTGIWSGGHFFPLE
jgi:hypothetical protein